MTPPPESPAISRRRIMQLLAAAVAAAAIAPQVAPALAPAPARSTWTGKTRWIGHC
jgi:hypothetical protein